jgi:hypothetical protein
MIFLFRFFFGDLLFCPCSLLFRAGKVYFGLVDDLYRVGFKVYLGLIQDLFRVG